WLCSGQSNMEWPLINTVDGAQTVAQANFPEIRLFTVKHDTATSPRADVEGKWVVTTPDEAAHFSAVGYFFGRELYQQLKLPVGLIHSSWGGTPAEAWTSHDALVASPELKPILDRYESSLNNLPQTQAAYARALAAWEEKNLYIDAGNKGEALGYADPAFAAADWSRMDLPQQFETAGLLIDGAVWFRKELDLPASWAGKDLVVNLPPIDDQDVTYFNGTKVGSIGPSDAEPVSLKGVWDYKVELALEPKHPDWGTRPEAVGVSNQNNPSVLYNAMLAPLVPFAIRGAIWYQGESNAGRAYQYRTLFPTMIRDWRRAWGSVFPFYFVQLPNWRARKAEPDESDWAELREAQATTLREPQTGMAITIDVGDELDLHPKNKL